MYPMSKITVTETINASIDRVFAIASDIPNAESFITSIESIETLEDAAPAPDNLGNVGLGYTWRETRIMFGHTATEDMSITKWSPPTSYTVEARSHGAHYLSDFTFDRIDDQNTRITMSFNATPETFLAKVMTKLFSFMNKKIAKCLSDDLKDIKSTAESENA